MKLLSKPVHRTGSSQAYLLFGFAIAFLLAVRYLRTIDSSKSDPSALFFNASRAYGARYSSIRIAEAERFIGDVDIDVSNLDEARQAAIDPTVCVGIATVQRENARYFKILIGSLLEGFLRGRT